MSSPQQDSQSGRENGYMSDEWIRRRRSVSSLAEDRLGQKPGWPLLRRLFSADPEVRAMSVVQWAMALPNRSEVETPHDSRLESLSEEMKCEETEERSTEMSCFEFGETGKRLESLLKSCNCKWLSYELLQTATNKFDSENLIGKGGCSQVYKGILQDGKQVAVKIRKSSSKEAMEDFVKEVEIVSSLNHNNITPLVGICIEDSNFISVYDFLTKGSLEDNLHGKEKGRTPLTWGSRFRIAVKVAEALNYLHNAASRAVIHRDVKSANILLSDGLETQLSDFGLAMWAPTASSFVTQADVVGTFGYLAPEYFMYGKVSDKIDVFAFGVVLLELISGREPIIASKDSKVLQSLVMWAKPIMESRNARDLLDPSLDGKFDESQLQRMVVAANLCITLAARLRPKMSEILRLLTEESDVTKWASIKDRGDDCGEEESENGDDEVYPNSSPELHLNLALLDMEDDEDDKNNNNTNNSSSAAKGSCPLSWEDYLKGRMSLSLSFE